jgi:hypothetical protein
MLPMDLRHRHIPWQRRLERRVQDLHEAIRRWVETPVTENLSRGELLAIVIGLVGLAYFIR